LSKFRKQVDDSEKISKGKVIVRMFGYLFKHPAHLLLVVVLTIVRKQIFIIIAYLLAMMMDVMVIDGLVIQYGIWGAGAAYGLAMGIVMLILSVVLITTILRRKEIYD
jgi:hypothetical protein